jgi:cysteine desulfurase family protein
MSLVYLDNASTAHPKSPVVVEAMADYLFSIGASPGRGGYGQARKSHELVDQVRRRTADLLGVARASNVAFSANATFALNTLIHGALVPGDHVVTTQAEHNSVLRPLEQRRRAGQSTYEVVRVGPDGRIDIEAFGRALEAGPRLVVVNHASNVTGAVAPVAELADRAHKAGALFLLDVSQTLGHLPVATDEWGVDLVAFTGHKAIGGPSGTGGLFVRDPETVAPLLQGGTGSNSQSLTHPHGMPAKFEAGTVNYLGIAGLGAALAELDQPAEAGPSAADLREECADRLRGLPRVRVVELDDRVDRVPVLSFTVDGFYPAEVAHLLEERVGVLVRSGLHCAPLIHESIGTHPQGTVRVSFGRSTDKTAVDLVCAGIQSL